jgi:hypothetical protein
MVMLLVHTFCSTELKYRPPYVLPMLPLSHNHWKWKRRRKCDPRRPLISSSEVTIVQIREEAQNEYAYGALMVIRRSFRTTDAPPKKEIPVAPRVNLKNSPNERKENVIP